MAFGDQINRQKSLIEAKAMNAKQVLTNCLTFVTPIMHKSRRQSLFSAVESVLNGATLSVTGMGRHISGGAKEKHKIKRVDRLCSNHTLHKESSSIYHNIINLLISKTKNPIIHVDWSDLDPRKQHFLIRASLATKGRSLTLYEEIHTLETKEKPLTHKKFMYQLHRMLPKDAAPIIITDAGFRIPWFKLVEELGWHYIGRVRHNTKCQKNDKETWFPIKNLYSLATPKAKDIGAFLLGQSTGFPTRFILLHRKSKNRHNKTATGERRRRSKQSLANANREKEPWLLASSLPEHGYSAKDITRLYGTRMQIEESFRDIKTGLGMNVCQTRTHARLTVIFLIGVIAQLTLYILGLAVKAAQLHWQYQANSVRNRQVLSNQFIGLRAYRDPSLALTKEDWFNGITLLNSYVIRPEPCN